ncbi:MAG: TetR/AcrR family transcriptional regulator [Myxococcota bacterium]
MPRPRFDRLEPERREAILDAAAAEFGEHGFSRASYNRIIDRAGLSKGAMYYYFADKRDLYLTVVRDAVGGLWTGLTPMEPVAGPPEFWREVERMAIAAWGYMLSAPRAAALAPAFLKAPASAEDSEVLAELTAQAAQWLRGVLEVGRGAGAVRDDIPDELLLAVTMAVGEAVDRWVGQQWFASREAGSPDEPMTAPSSELVDTLIDLLRRVVAPA